VDLADPAVLAQGLIEMNDELMAEQVEINPVLAAAPFGTPEGSRVKAARFFVVADLYRDVKRSQRHRLWDKLVRSHYVARVIFHHELVATAFLDDVAVGGVLAQQLHQGCAGIGFGDPKVFAFGAADNLVPNDPVVHTGSASDQDRYGKTR
jgi:hypothetical protein